MKNMPDGLASASCVYKYLLSKQWFYIASGTSLPATINARRTVSWQCHGKIGDCEHFKKQQEKSYLCCFVHYFKKIVIYALFAGSPWHHIGTLQLLIKNDNFEINAITLITKRGQQIYPWDFNTWQPLISLANFGTK